jgi:hypothetical protein
MKGEDGSRAPWMVMQTWKERCTGRNTLCASPRIALGSRRSGSPGGSRPRISNFRNFSTYHSRQASSHYYGIIQLQVRPPQHLSQLQCSTKQQHQQRPQIFVVLELTSKVPQSPVQRISRQAAINDHDSDYGLGVNIGRKTNSVSITVLAG